MPLVAVRAALAAGVAAAAALPAAAVSAAAQPQQCAGRSVGPGALRRGGTAGAACLLRAFQHGCRPAAYKLSLFGVDTIAATDFRTVRGAGRCTVVVTASFAVVPQPPHLTGTRRCTALDRRGADVVASRCSGGPPATISLAGSP